MFFQSIMYDIIIKLIKEKEKMSNPVLNENAVENFRAGEGAFEVMTISGVVLKTTFLFTILLFTAFYTFSLILNGFIDKASMLGTVGAIGGFIVAMVVIFARNSKILAPLTMLYAALEGLFIGGVSALFAKQAGFTIVAQAVLATLATLFAMLFLYSAKLISCTEKFKSTIMIATFGVLVIYVVTLIMSFFNPASTSLLMGATPVGIGFSAIVCLIAAFNLIVDFHIIETAKNMNLDKSFEWYGGFSLMVTLVWLYIEFLKLLSKLNSRN